VCDLALACHPYCRMSAICSINGTSSQNMAPAVALDCIGAAALEVADLLVALYVSLNLEHPLCCDSEL